MLAPPTLNLCIFLFRIRLLEHFFTPLVQRPLPRPPNVCKCSHNHRHRCPHTAAPASPALLIQWPTADVIPQPPGCPTVSLPDRGAPTQSILTPDRGPNHTAGVSIAALRWGVGGAPSPSLASGAQPHRHRCKNPGGPYLQRDTICRRFCRSRCIL